VPFKGFVSSTKYNSELIVNLSAMNKFIDYLLQAILIIFSVVLGFMLNELRQNIQQGKQVNKVLELIQKEIATNELLLNNNLEYHIKVVENFKAVVNNDDSLQQLINEEGFSLYYSLAPDGVLNRGPTNTAWETAKINGITGDIEYELLESLARTYQQQEIVYLPVTNIIDVLHSKNIYNELLIEANLNTIGMKFREMTGREYRLQQYYSNSLELLDKIYN